MSTTRALCDMSSRCPRWPIDSPVRQSYTLHRGIQSGLPAVTIVSVPVHLRCSISSLDITQIASLSLSTHCISRLRSLPILRILIPVVQFSVHIRPDNSRFLPIFGVSLPKLDVHIMIIACNRTVAPCSPLPLQHALVIPIAQSKRGQRPEHIRNDVKVIEVAANLQFSVQSCPTALSAYR